MMELDEFSEKKKEIFEKVFEYVCKREKSENLKKNTKINE